MNKVILSGRITKDAEVKINQEEVSKTFTRFTLAVDRRFKNTNTQSADFINCVAFGKTAEFLGKFGKKGTKFLLEGRIQTGSYTNKDGQKIFTTDILVENIEFAESKSANSNSVSEKQLLELPDENEVPFD